MTTTFARNTFGSFVALALGMTFVGAATAPAHAATADTASVSVSYADLNLATPAGQSVLAARVKAAAKTVCASDMNDIASRSADAQCVDAAVASAMAATRA